MAQITTIQTNFNRRFLAAVNYLISLGRVGSLRQFITDCGLIYSRYTEFDREFGQNKRVSRYKSVEIEALYALANDYKVNMNWLVTGRGDMMQ